MLTKAHACTHTQTYLPKLSQHKGTHTHTQTYPPQLCLNTNLKGELRRGYRVVMETSEPGGPLRLVKGCHVWHLVGAHPVLDKDGRLASREGKHTNHAARFPVYVRARVCGYVCMCS